MVFVTRKFPPSIGGMQTLSAGVWRSLRSAWPGSSLIAHSGENRALWWWFPLAWLRLAVRLARHRRDVVLAGDALTWAVVEPLTRLFRVRGATMVMGLDMSHPGRLYQAVVGPALRRAPSVIAISQASAGQARSAGVDPGRVAVLRLGVPVPPRPDRPAARHAVHEMLGLPSDAFVVLTLGRLVRRKGVRWFVENVLPDLPANVHYAVAGDGPEADLIESASRAGGVASRVHLMGRVDDDTRKRLLAGCDLFVQPNIPVPGDLEGFGLVVVEAALRGTAVVAAALEGIRDAVVDGETGILLAPGDAEVWCRAVSELAKDAERTRTMGHGFSLRAAELYSEESMGEALRYLLDR